jgi:hypothetical protein
LEDDEIVLLTKFMKKQRSFIGERDLTIFLVMLDTGVRLSETLSKFQFINRTVPLRFFSAHIF